MSATNTSRTVGIDTSNINVGTSTTLTASADSTTPASDTAQTGDVKALANSTAQAAILNTTISIGSGGVLTAIENGAVGTLASTNAGNATVRATNDGPTGAILNTTLGANQISVGSNAEVQANAQNDAAAWANTGNGVSSATANTGRVFGLKNVGLTAKGTSLEATALVNNSAIAISGGLPGNGSTALSGAMGRTDREFSGLAKAVGIYASGAKAVLPQQPTGDQPTPQDDPSSAESVQIFFGSNAPGDVPATLTAIGSGSFDAFANAGTGPVRADGVAKLVAGIAVGENHLSQEQGPNGPGGPTEPVMLRKGGLAIGFGKNGTVVAQGTGDASATSETTTGTAGANASIETIGGIVDLNRLAGSITAPQDFVPGLSTLWTGGNGSIDARAQGTGSASATTVTAPDKQDVLATSNNGKVVGIAINKLHVGANATQLLASAASIQEATAQSTTSGGDPKAQAANGDLVAGFHNTTVFVGNDLSQSPNTNTAEALLNAKAQASGVTTSTGSTAEAGVGSQVVGFNQGSLTIGGGVLGATQRGVFRATGSSTLSSIADATTGNATALAGGSGSRVIGLNQAPVSIGKEGSVAATASGSVEAQAINVSRDSRADATQTALGIKDSAISVGNNGDVSGTAILSGSALAGKPNIGPNNGNASAATTLEAKGIDNDVTISIGKAGAVTGRATATDRGTNAVSTTGNAGASSNLKAIGIHLGGIPNTIGTTGNTTGTAVAEAAPVLATTTTGNASFDVNQGVVGIKGSEGSSISSGVGGVIDGSATGSGSGVASSTTTTPGGMASGNTHSWIAGIKKVDLTASSVMAKGEGDYDTNAIATTGPALAVSDVSVAGLLGCNNTAELSGNLTAQASLVNTVLASTVTGAATAIATGDVVGIRGYDISISGSGDITASAVNHTSAIASTTTVV